MGSESEKGVTTCEVPGCDKDNIEFYDLAGEIGVMLCEEHESEMFDFGTCTVRVFIYRGGHRPMPALTLAFWPVEHTIGGRCVWKCREMREDEER